MAGAPISYKINIDDHGLAHQLELLGAAGLVKAEREAVGLHVKATRGKARGMAPFLPNKVSGTTKMKAGVVRGSIKITDYRLRFRASGVANGGDSPRRTRRGYNRGVESAIPFMEATAHATDPLVQPLVETRVLIALRQAGLVG